MTLEWSKSGHFCQRFINHDHVFCCCQEVLEVSAEGGLSGAASGAEVATAGASEAGEEATGEDTAQGRWTQGEIHSHT